jgi:hypothetical protein
MLHPGLKKFLEEAWPTFNIIWYSFVGCSAVEEVDRQQSQPQSQYGCGRDEKNSCLCQELDPSHSCLSLYICTVLCFSSAEFSFVLQVLLLEVVIEYVLFENSTFT